MIIVYCDGCGMTLPNDRKTIQNCMFGLEELYCADCQLKYDELDEWYGIELEKRKEQLKKEALTKKVEMFKWKTHTRI